MFGKKTRKGKSHRPKDDRPGFVIVWDPSVISEDDYAALIVALGDLVRANGGAGIRRITTRGFGVTADEGVRV